jgi:hypothetical protein
MEPTSMKGKRSTSKDTGRRTATKNKQCPRCKRHTLRKDSKTPGGKQRWACREASGDRRTCYTTTNPDAPFRDQAGKEREADKNPQFRRALGGKKRFVITSAQNATPLHDGFFGSLRTYCEYHDAELIVIPIRYKNPTSKWTDSQENSEIWDPSLTPYLYNQRKKLNENLTLVGDIKTVPTATKPLSGFESITGSSSGIFGHTKLQMTTIATPCDRYPKILTSTGACTVKNYTDSKAGKKGEFHHALAAVVVEVVGKKYSLRHVNAMPDGTFIDLEYEYSPTGVANAGPALALVLGDTHRATMDKTVEKVTFEGENSMVETLDPQHLVFHDLHDGVSTNHHTRKDPFAQVAKRVANLHIVEDEVEQDVEWLKKVCTGRQGVLVASNHDDFLARWLREQDWRMDPDNSEFYLETALHLVRSIKSGDEVPHPFTYWVDRLKGDAPIRCLRRDESFQLGGVELSLHGDQGPNGSRGSRENLRRIGVKTVVGHSHSPGIEEGCYQAGTSTPLRVDYNTGPSSWLQAHVVVYANGKRAILPIIDGVWRQ